MGGANKKSLGLKKSWWVRGYSVINTGYNKRRVDFWFYRLEAQALAGLTQETAPVDSLCKTEPAGEGGGPYAGCSARAST